ncbi:hypothetical protein SPI_06650 [Niveomyces insectorum RCEF 264]|uniref:AMP-activated protein kinase glycogen-binding domain-containing protein n=1 Tax=Niveomyces insectorum RCEF 264 TaxID=1081102 RepID=A0A167RGR6_9HYPO|nr:hypothetical protein SPI_06650 [Niveomyces insectorum RCEF 264]
MAKGDAAVEITYKSTDLEPPLFVAGSFSNPPWTPQEMKHAKAPSGEHVFTKTIHAEPGSTIQYKFRVGRGDWWILDDTLPTVTDDKGNQNNMIKVMDQKSALAEEPSMRPPDSPRLRTIDAEPKIAKPAAPTKGPVGNLKKKHASSLSPSPSRSNTSTPSFVRTTIEVADSAAQLDKEGSEPEISDREAGRLGVRRLTSTPIAKVAATAAEVADVAERLDSHSGDEDTQQADVGQVDIGPEFAHERPGSTELDDDSAPMFAYECADGRGSGSRSLTDAEREPAELYSASDRGSEEDFDPDDPSLERFPSNREEIFSRVRTLSTGLNPDPASFDGVPPSPVVTPGRKSSVHLGGDALSISPTTPLSSCLQPGQRSDPQRRSASKDSQGSDVTLDPIVEENTADDRLAATSQTGAQNRALTPQISPKTATHDFNPDAMPGTHDTPSVIVHEAEASAAPKTSPNTSPDSPQRSTQNSPSPTGKQSPATPGDQAANSPAPPSLVRRLAPSLGTGNAQEQPRSDTPASHHSVTVEAAKNANWFTALFRLVFIDWFGGLLGRVFRWRQH